MTFRPGFHDPERKLLVHGTPITPAALLPQLAGRSFCVSFMDPRQAAVCAELVGPRELLLLDNGAFTAWRKGLELDAAHWSRFYAWSDDLLARCPQAVAVIPDVIGGAVRDNLALIEACPLPPERSMPIWHMHEPLALLRRYARRFHYVGIGSSGDFAQLGTAAWKARIAQALAELAAIAERRGSKNFIHMMRGMAQLGAWPFSSADSTNVARNHCRHRGQPEHVRRFAERLAAKVAA